MTDHLLIWTLGPVQPFIEAARKSQDLWVGSFLLSSLMEEALAVVQPPAEVIYPFETTIDPQLRIPDLPNTFVARCTGASAPLIAARARSAVEARWNAIQQQVWRNLSAAVSGIKVAKAQWDEHTDPAKIFEFYWAAASIGMDYGAAFKNLRNGLNDRKRLRAFEQLRYNGEKSTITGEHAALQPPHSSRKDVVRFWQQVSRELQRGHKYIRTDGTERLGAIDMVKRLAASGVDHPLPVEFNGFPSTSTVAAAPFIAAVLDCWDQGQGIQVGKAIIDWLAALRSPFSLGVADEGDPFAMPFFEPLGVQLDSTDPRRRLLKQDGDALFAPTYSLKRLVRDFGLSEENAAQHGQEIEAQCRQAVDQLHGLVNTVREARGALTTPPIPYFAALTLDGDNMGDTIGAVRTSQEHQEISRALSTFARQHAPQLVERDVPARLVYAGGDDVLALAPIEAALPLADTLRIAFADTLRPVVHSQEPHASAGICIAHHQDPLGRTLRVARAAEKAAKDAYGRNSIVVTLLRRSGEHTTVGMPWHDQDGTATIRRLINVLDLFRHSRLSPKFAQIVVVEAPTLVALPAAAQRAELRRLLHRQWTDTSKLRDFVATSLADHLQTHWKNGSAERPADLGAALLEICQRYQLPLSFQEIVAAAAPIEHASECPDAITRLLDNQQVTTALLLNIAARLLADDLVSLAEAIDSHVAQRGRPVPSLPTELRVEGPRRGIVEVSGWLSLLAFMARGGRE